MTTEPISDERLAEIRAGLVGCTPGPWMLEIETSEHVDESEEDRQPEVYVCSSDTCCDYTVVATMGRAEAISHDRKSRDASHIARLDPQTVAAILSRLDKAEAGWQPTKAPDAIVRDGFASKIEWIRAYRAKHNAPLKEALKAYEDGTPLDGAPATFEVHQEGCA